MPKVIPQGDAALPPPGDERRETLRERADTLAEAAETANPDRERIDPKALRVEPEIAQHVDDLDVSNKQDDYAYCWVYTGQHGRMIRMKLAEKWEVVQGDMPEAVELKGVGADTTRRLGDVLLMRIRRDHFKLLQKRDEKARAARQGAVTARLEELGDRYRREGVIVHPDMTEMDPRTQQRMMNRAQVRQLAGREVDRMIRQGSVPGMPAPGEE